VSVVWKNVLLHFSPQKYTHRLGSLEKCTATFFPSKCTGTFKAVPADFAGICHCRRSNIVDTYEYASRVVHLLFIT
jgi:hypothetical protein